MFSDFIVILFVFDLVVSERFDDLDKIKFQVLE